MIKTIHKTAIFLSCLTLGGSAMAKEIAGNVEKAQNPTNILAFNCTPSTSGIVMNVNNVRTYILGGGDFWWDLDNAKYEVPSGSGKHSVFAGSIWIGGLSANDNLKVAAMTYRQTGNDFWPGPLDNNETIFNPVTGLDEDNPNYGQTNVDICSEYDTHFKITLEEVADFVAEGTMTPAIASWPGNGVNGELNEMLAPFYDIDQDGVYEPLQGDYPAYDIEGSADCKGDDLLFGDETIFWVYNDRGNTHTESGAEAIGIEIRSQAFGFQTNDEINDMTFYNYKIINRSVEPVKQTYFGTWVDSDVGNYEDDFVGCDVARGLGYTYNGDANDEGVTGYGLNPPALGMDFFQGPKADANDGIDNDKDGCVDCTYRELEDGTQEEIDDDVLPEGIIMSKFIYYNNDFDAIRGNPNVSTDFYNYLSGKWKNGNPITYGGIGTDPSNPPCDYLFPNNTDPKFPTPWTEETAGNAPADRRFIITAGPFTLEPGAVNNITTGLVWARANQGGPFASVNKMILADDKAQALFDNCFEVLNGPEAPDLKFQSYDKKMIVTMENYYNEKTELYAEEDPTLISSDAVPINDKLYRFEGYQIFQVLDETVTASELYNLDKSRLIFQSDVKNSKEIVQNDGTVEEKEIDKLVNYVFNDDIGAYVPQDMTISANNQGLKHSFEITQDAFAEGDKRLVNNKTYHFISVAYAFNEYTPYKQDQQPIVFDELTINGETTLNEVSEHHPNLNGQKRPYLAGRIVKNYKARPYPNTETLHGTYGTRPAMTRVQGKGSGGFELEIAEASESDIINNYCGVNVEYKENAGPVDIYVINPDNLSVADYKFMLMNSDASEVVKSTTDWMLIQNPGTTQADTVYSLETVGVNNEQIIPKWGLAVNMNINQDAPFVALTTNNGYINSSIEYENLANQWLYFMPDQDYPNPFNWISAGSQSRLEDGASGGSTGDYAYLDATYDGRITGVLDINLISDDTTYSYAPIFLDPTSTFENIVGGTWAPYELAGFEEGFQRFNAKSFFSVTEEFLDLPSIKFVMTPNKDLWTRALVIDTDPTKIGSKQNKNIRNDLSVGKNGNPDGSGTVGWSWFPGYAIDKTSGKRLNICFGEDATNPDENGANMIFDPTTTIGNITATPDEESNLIYSGYELGGRHYIYVMNSTYQGDDESKHPDWDLIQKFVGTSFNQLDKKEFFKNMVWTSIPMLAENQELNASEITINIDISQPLKGWENDQDLLNCTGVDENNKLPIYTFNTGSIETTNFLTDNKVDDEVDLVNVVPNPYYGGSEYETGQIDHRVRITNVPSNTLITIYTVDGALIKQINAETKGSYDWDLKNDKGISVASGMYLVHLKTPTAERVIKWVGTLRPIDLDSF